MLLLLLHGGRGHIPCLIACRAGVRGGSLARNTSLPGPERIALAVVGSSGGNLLRVGHGRLRSETVLVLGEGVCESEYESVGISMCAFLCGCNVCAPARPRTHRPGRGVLQRGQPFEGRAPSPPESTRSAVVERDGRC